jgi:hypothetical protein
LIAGSSKWDFLPSAEDKLSAALLVLRIRRDSKFGT